MYRAIEVTSPGHLEQFLRPLHGFELGRDGVNQSHPDQSWMLSDGAGGTAARCSLWWKGTPPQEGERIGLIGHYADIDAPAGAQLLELACERLRAEGCTLAIGPMDGSTWRRYRFITDRGNEPLFLLEPDNADTWPAHFTEAGFAPLANYYSALNPDVSCRTDRDRQMEAVAARMQGLGVSLRPLHLDAFNEELRRIYALSLRSFQENFLYTQIAEEEFVAQYRDARPYVRHELMLLAEQGERLVGFVFGIPDLLQARRGNTVDTAIIKTLAVDPAMGGQGLGAWLVASCEEAARALGFKRVIHALMHETNKSGRISRHSAVTMRRYTLFSKPLNAAQATPRR